MIQKKMKMMRKLLLQDRINDYSIIKKLILNYNNIVYIYI